MTPSYFKRNLIALALSAIVATGCGGGSSTTSTSTPSTSATIGGAAAKGIVSNGIITAYELNAQGVKGDAVGNTTTDTDGSYSLTLDAAYDGTSALLIELTADATTLMVCDALNGCGSGARGETFTPPADFILRAILPAATAGSTISAQVTPFTHMAAGIITAGTDTSAAAVQAAIAKVTQLVGVNIMETKPVDITKNISTESVEAQRYALMLAAIASRAFQDADGDGDIDPADMQANIQHFADDFADGQLGDNTNGLKPADLVAAMNAELAHPDNKNNVHSDALTGAQQANDLFEGDIDESGHFTPTTPINTSGTDIAKAKALVKETRTWITALGDLETPTQAFGEETETITETFDTNAQAVLEVVELIIATAGQAIGDAQDTQQTIPTSVEVQGETVTITDNSETGTTSYTISTPASGISGVNATFTISLNQDISSSTVAAGDVILSVNGQASNSLTKITLAETTVTLTLASSFELEEETEINAITETIRLESKEEEAKPDITAASFKGGISIEKLSDGSATGDKIEGNAEIKLIKLTAIEGATTGSANLSLQKVAFNNIKITNSKGEYAGLSVTLTIDNATTFDTFGFLDSDTVMETTNRFIKASLNITGKLKLDGQPEATASLTINKTGIKAGDATLTIAHNGQSVTLVYHAKTGDDDATLTITNPAGVKLELSAVEDATKGTVSVNGTVVGILEEIKDKDIIIIRYNNGTFETL